MIIVIMIIPIILLFMIKNSYLKNVYICKLKKKQTRQKFKIKNNYNNNHLY